MRDWAGCSWMVMHRAETGGWPASRDMNVVHICAWKFMLLPVPYLVVLDAGVGGEDPRHGKQQSQSPMRWLQGLLSNDSSDHRDSSLLLSECSPPLPLLLPAARATPSPPHLQRQVDL